MSQFDRYSDRVQFYRNKSGQIFAKLDDEKMIDVSAASKTKSHHHASRSTNASATTTVIRNDHEHLSTIFPNKSKSSGDHRDIDDNQERGPTNSPFDLIEHDVSGLSVLSSLPKPDSFDALQIGSDRLRTIIAALQCNIIVRKEDLVRNLDYVANVLETVHQDETRRLMEEDDGALSEIEPDSVPNEVRDWLAMTFTRSMSTIKRRPSDKPKFKSVAQAIRAGIMVDRLFRRTTLAFYLDTIQQTINEWTFDVFSVNEFTNGQCLRYVGFELMQRYNLPNKLHVSINALHNFLEQMESGYSKHRNPYHNLIHAADVLQTTYQIIYNSSLMNWLNDHELFAMFIAAIIHDFEHTGTSNNFHIQSRSDTALIYNDRAVLENHHVSAAFRLMRIDDYNILSEFSSDEFKNFRYLVIEMVLATDMSSHFTQLKTMKSLLSMPENIEKSKALALVLHSADISHPGKPWTMHHTWTELLMEEYFKQGEKEKELGLPCSPLCDRDNTLVAESQIGFIQYIVEPSFVVMGDMLEKILKSFAVPDSELPSPSIPPKSAASSSSPSLSPKSSNESNPHRDDQLENGRERKPSSMTTPISRPTTVRRPWIEYLKENRERWIREADEEKRRRELKVIEEEV
ncbi:unnamed protein product [Rotaria magnacalcarata]|uniref:Phosphodiesterase n=1 Tax=Rotaria magnacalcarata TaxID=392030 RepID=A0A816PK09_9BILA|nr:unnamed protein product [Rotaria magnacalcarata]CAF2062072.1 unnamed protein product [Rotaria magnacalcarata]CAF2062075.1 unnamed protein product [Rotaria magnacalcarata]